MKPYLLGLGIIYLAGVVIYAAPLLEDSVQLKVSIWQIADAVWAGTAWPATAVQAMISRF
ncbi:MAG: hypothetical protein AAF530_14840 [Pseudomonadota bacterium]